MKQRPALPEGTIDRIWQRMTDIYGHKWTSGYGDCDKDGTWAMGLADMTNAELRAGFVACVKRSDPWPPSLPEFRSLCRPVQERRENAAAYRFSPDRQLPYKIGDDQRAIARQALAAARQAIKS